MYNSSMKIILHKWGNSLGLRIPKAFAVELGITSGEEIEISLAENCLRITPTTYHLNALLQKVTPENMHEETFADAPQGYELW